jgi:hypothetical protein
MPLVPIKYTIQWQRGKLYGYISEKKGEFRVYFGKRHSRPSKGFRFTQYGTKNAALERAQTHLIKMNQRYKMASNRWRWINNTFDTFEMELTKGKTMLADSTDLDFAEKYLLHADCDGDRWYVKASVNGDRKVRFHRLIMYPDDDQQIDHINGNPLDNRRNNLRICSQSVNMNNRKLSKNSTTLINGVTPRHKNGILDRYVAHKYVKPTRQTKSFSINKYGEAEALTLATRWRQAKDEGNDCTNGSRQ